MEKAEEGGKGKHAKDRKRITANEEGREEEITREWIQAMGIKQSREKDLKSLSLRLE